MLALHRHGSRWRTPLLSSPRVLALLCPQRLCCGLEAVWIQRQLRRQLELAPAVQLNLLIVCSLVVSKRGSQVSSRGCLSHACRATVLTRRLQLNRLQWGAETQISRSYT